MTSEIAVLNSQAIALAADSAVTLPNGKIYNSANKIFSLSNFAPIGIMVFGNGQFMNIPWETVVSIYKKKLAQTRFATLQDYCKDFLKFLESKDLGITEDAQKAYVIYMTNIVIDSVLKDTDFHNKSNNLDKTNRCSLLIDVLNQEFTKLLKETAGNKYFDDTPDFAKRFKKNYYSAISKVLIDKFGECTLPNELLTNLFELVKNIFLLDLSKLEPMHTLSSGVVIAGFGEKEIFPAICSYEIFPLVNSKLQYIQQVNKTGAQSNVGIIPFAQREMIDSFMQGIDPNYKLTFDEYLKNLLSTGLLDTTLEVLKKNLSLNDTQLESVKNDLSKANSIALNDLQKQMLNLSKAGFTDPIMDVVQSLPKGELAEMAETLVNLISFKRKVSRQQETVGGPIDVVVISKADGLIWVKKKTYFSHENNPGYINNLFKN